MTLPLGGPGKASLQTDPPVHERFRFEVQAAVPEIKPGMLARLWNGVKEAGAQARNYALIQVVSNLDKNKGHVEIEMNRLRDKLEKSTGTSDIADLIRKQTRDNLPWILDEIRNKVRTEALWLQEPLEYALASSPNLLHNCMEATLLKMMDNLVERVKQDKEGKPLPDPIPPREVIERIMALGSALGSEELADFQKLQTGDHEVPGIYETRPDYEERRVCDAIADRLLEVALPHGSEDLIVPPGIAGSFLSTAAYVVIGSIQLPKMIMQLSEKTKQINNFHLGLLGYLKEVSNDGDAVAKAIHPLIGKFAEQLQNKAKESGDSISDPLLRGLVGPFLKESDHSPQFRMLLQKADTFIYPLVIHVLGNLAMHAESPATEKKELLTLVSGVCMKDILEFARHNDRDKLLNEIAAYEMALRGIQTGADESVKAIETQTYGRIAAIEAARTTERDKKIADIRTKKSPKEADEIRAVQKKCSDLIAREAAPVKVEGDNRKAEIKKRKEKKLAEIKSPFEPLIKSLVLKMGVDEEGLADILPFFQKEASEKIQEMLNEFCIDYFKIAVMQEGKPPEAAKRMVGQREARSLIQDLVKKAITALKKSFAEKATEEKSVFSDLLASADMDALQYYAEPYISDLASDLLVHLADSNPLKKDQDQIDLVSSALQNLALIASEKLGNNRLRTQVTELVSMPEGPAKEAKKKLIVGPIAEEVAKRAGWGDEANIRLPKLLRGKAKELLANDILPDLICTGAKLFLDIQLTLPDNEKALQHQATDGDAVLNAVKTLAGNTGAIVADLAYKTGVALETSAAQPKEAGLEYLLRDEILSAIHKYPFLAQLKDPILQNSLVKMLKEAQTKSEMSGLLIEADKITLPLLMHVLARLTEGVTKQSTIGAGINRLLQALFGFAAENRKTLEAAWPEHQERLEAVEREFAKAFEEKPLAKAEKLKEARKPFKALFVPLIEDVLIKAGLDAAGLSKVLPIGASPLSGVIKSEALDFCVDFYEEVIATQGRVPDVAKDMPGYREGRHLLQGMMVELMPAIREALAKEDNRRDIQTALSDEINDRLFYGKLPLDKDWIMQPVAEVVSDNSPYFDQLRAFAEPYIVDSVTDLLAQLAASFKGPPEGDMAERAIAHLIEIMMREVKDPELVKKLAAWKALPEATEEEKRMKSKAKSFLREEIFGACASQILDAAGWHDSQNIRSPKVLRPIVLRLMEKTVLPDQLFRIAAEMMVPKALSLNEQRCLDEMGGTDNLKKVAEGLSEKLTPIIISKSREYADLIAAKCNEKLTLNNLSVHDEACLGSDIDGLLIEGKPTLKPAWQWIEGLISRTLQDGLTRLALNYDGPNQGDVAANIALYLRKKLTTFSITSEMGSKIRDYSKKTEPLKALDRQITELRKLAVREKKQVGILVGDAIARCKAEQSALQLAEQNKMLDRLLRDHAGDAKLTAKIIKRQKDLPAKIARELDAQFQFAEKHQDRPLDSVLKDLKKQRLQLEAKLDQEFGIKASYQEILKSFEPEVKMILADMGYATAQELPTPYAKDTLWKNLAHSILPDLCLTVADKLLAGYDGLIPDMRKDIKTYDDKLKERYLRRLPAGVKPEKSTPIVNGVNNLAEYLVREIESRVDLQSEEKALEFLESIPDQHWGGKGRAAVLGAIYPNREEIAQWIGKESPEFMKVVKGRLGESLQQMITAPLLKLSYTFINHLDELERKSPEKLFDFVFNAVPMMTDHIKTANEITKKYQKNHIHEVDPLHMLAEFERRGKLHPAMPGFIEMRALSEQEHYVRQLEGQVALMTQPGGNSRWYENVDRLKEAEKTSETIRKQLELGPEYYLREAKTNRRLLQQKIDDKLKQNFYKDFSSYLMKMAGLNGPQDIPGTEEFWNLLGMSKQDGWETFDNLAPQMILEGMRAAFAPEKLNSYFAKVMVSLNNNLTERRKKGEWQPIEIQPAKNRRLEDKVAQMEDRCNQLVEQLGGMLSGLFISELREMPFFEDVPGKVLAESLRDALRANPLSHLIEDGLAEGLKQLPQQLPKTYEEKHAADRKGIEENLRNIALIRAEAEKTVPNFVKKLENSLVDKWRRTHKKIDNWLEKTFGNSAVEAKAFLGRIFHIAFLPFVFLYKGMRWLLSFGIEWFGRHVGRKVELARLGIVGTDAMPNFVNANLMYRLADAFKECYSIS